jgi:hypothetical protein
MSNQSENKMQQTQTPEEIRQHLLAQVEASKKTLEDLSEEELEAVAGGSFLHSLVSAIKDVGGVAGNYYKGIANGLTGGHL